VSWPILVLSYLGTALASAGAGVGWSYIRWGKPPSMQHADEGSTMSHTPGTRTIVTVVALLVIGVGTVWFVTDRAVDRAKVEQAQARTQEAEEQAAAFARYAGCLRDWGTALTEKINVSRDKRATFDAADLERTDTFAEVFRIVTRLRAVPPRATTADLDTALEAFERADARYRRAYGALPDSKMAPYKAPDLTCSIAETKKETDR